MPFTTCRRTRSRAAALPLPVVLAACGEPDVSLLLASRGVPDEHDLALAPEDAPGPEELHIELVGVTNSGKGCPEPDSIATEFSTDPYSLDVTYHALNLVHPPGPQFKFSGCMTAVELVVQSGWQVAIGYKQVTGHAYLDDGLKARVRERYSFVGVPGELADQLGFEGVAKINYDVQGELSPADAVWSSCGGLVRLRIEASLFLDATADADAKADLAVTGQKALHLRARRC